ncbi:MAG TPA: ubiquinol-cytochrome c reductase iron-sulfur subunit [Anaerolineales bacterium]|nr:ubiquinol-cytochrome c reductase iron-sulfur subunit [Anaerolineales bacterium]
MDQGSYSSRLSRNGFVKAVTVAIGSIMGFVLGLPAIAYLISPGMSADDNEVWIPVGPLEKYPSGFPTRFSFTRTRVNGWEKTALSYGVYVLRKSDDQVIVYSDICTHLGCRVKWRAELQEYVSPCHDGHFDIDGKVTKGPPPRPLDRFESKVEAGNLYMKLNT